MNNSMMILPNKERGLKHNLVMLSDIIDADPSSYEEVAKKKGKESTSSRRMMSRMEYLQPPTCSRWKHHGI